MNQLIAIRSQAIGGQQIQTVNARDLHAFLEVGKDFSTWIKDRIEQYEFLENQDFIVDSPISGNQAGRGGDRRSRQYHLTLDMAKELSMVERNAKGKQARQYFLDCERRAKAAGVDPLAALSDPATLRGMLLSYSEKMLALESANEEMKPKVEALDRIAIADGSLCLTDAAKCLQVRPKDLFAWLSQNHWTYRRTGGSGWLAYQDKLQRGVLEHKVTTVERSDGTEKVVEQVRVTPKGLAKLAELMPGAKAA